MIRLPAWDRLPEAFRTEELRPYYLCLRKRRGSLFFKRIFDITAALGLLFILAVPMAVLALWIRLDSEGPVFFRQERVTAFGRRFRIHKFRTMRTGAERAGQLTTAEDPRVTKVGARLRDKRLDELPQLFDVLSGNMSFVGARPEVPRYVEAYGREALATLLTPAGISSEAAIAYKDEAKLLEGLGPEQAHELYLREILPRKIAYNLQYVRKFTLLRDLHILFATLRSVLRKEERR